MVYELRCTEETALSRKLLAMSYQLLVVSIQSIAYRNNFHLSFQWRRNLWIVL